MLNIFITVPICLLERFLDLIFNTLATVFNEKLKIIVLFFARILNKCARFYECKISGNPFYR